MENSLSFKKVATFISLITLAFLAACASTKVSDRETLYSGPLPRPNQIIVYDFVTTPEGVLPDSALAMQDTAPSIPLTPQEAELNRQLGMQIAVELAQEIRNMGLPGVRATQSTTPQVNDIMLRGYLLTVDKGSAVERVALGLGAGASDLKTLIEGYQMTPQGPRKLGQGDVNAGGSHDPGCSRWPGHPSDDPQPGRARGIDRGLRRMVKQAAAPPSRAGPKPPPKRSPISSKFVLSSRAGSCNELFENDVAA